MVIVFFNNNEHQTYYDVIECKIIEKTFLYIIQEKKETFINLVNVKSFVVEE